MTASSEEYEKNSTDIKDDSNLDSDSVVCNSSEINSLIHRNAFFFRAVQQHFPRDISVLTQPVLSYQTSTPDFKIVPSRDRILERQHRQNSEGYSKHDVTATGECTDHSVPDPESIGEGLPFSSTLENAPVPMNLSHHSSIPDLVECSTPPISPGESKQISVIEDISNRHLDSLEAIVQDEESDPGDASTMLGNSDTPKSRCLRSTSSKTSENKHRPRLQKTVSWSDEGPKQKEVNIRYFSVDQLQGRRDVVFEREAWKDIYGKQQKNDEESNQKVSTAGSTSDAVARRDSFRKQKESSGYGTGEGDQEEEEDVFIPQEGTSSSSSQPYTHPLEGNAPNMSKLDTNDSSFQLSSFQISSQEEHRNSQKELLEHTPVPPQKGNGFDMMLLVDPPEISIDKEDDKPQDDQPSSFIRFHQDDLEKRLRTENIQAMVSDMFTNMEPETLVERLPSIVASSDSEPSPPNAKCHRKHSSKSLSTPSTSSAKSKTPGSGGDSRVFSFEDDVDAGGNLHTIPEEPGAHNLDAHGMRNEQRLEIEVELSPPCTNSSLENILLKAARCFDPHCTDVSCLRGKNRLKHVEDHLHSEKQIWQCVTCRHVLQWASDHAGCCAEVRCPLQWCSFFCDLSDEDADEQMVKLVSEYQNLMLEPFTDDMKIIKLQRGMGDSQARHWDPITRMGKFGSAVLAVPEINCDGKNNDICYWFIKKMKHNAETLDLLKSLSRQEASAYIVQHLWVALDSDRKFMHVCSCYETGQTLGDLIGAVQPAVRAKYIKVYLRQILEAAHFLHQRNIVYLLWTDSNIVLNYSKEIAKLSNFSAAVSVETQGTEESMADIALRLPTDIAPPELLQGECPNAKSDSWGLGCLIYHLITSRSVLHSFRHDNPEMIRTKVRTQQIRLPDVSSVEDAVLAHLMSKCLQFLRQDRLVAIDLKARLK
ncbi:uncharacterized protein LOC106181796 [Lingula anatina]|uniref:non-specific serine/threonine protein kinase n=1 Tax=Lingula anatina TaxID=7574 RepID=A0A1S3KGG0_LINAN|nr:uncharacterized protein LOC106181796 [Lingula anatina]XP_013421731.1 uncharacterized protein LOC106181796 [Lingula anatina]|eukprot:XP_013421730.1 uncharacterized protein LOC106181796 [Lingula anatina]